MELATIKSQAEEDTLTAYLRTLSSTVGYAAGFWIGAINSIDNTGFYWLSTGEPVVYNAFITGQPDFLGSEHCLSWYIVTANTTFGWNNYNCDAELNYVCQSLVRCV